MGHSELLSPAAWALLDTLYRAKQEGLLVMEDDARFRLQAAELRRHGLALSFGSGMVITSKGEAAFRSRQLS